MTIMLRELVLPEDYTYIAAILNSFYSESISAEQLALEAEKMPSKGNPRIDEEGRLAGHDWQRIVAVDERNWPLGYGLFWRAPWTAPGELNQLIVVLPSERERGIGRLLYEELRQRAQKLGAAVMNMEVRDDDEVSQRFAERRDFIQERHQFESVLYLDSYDLEPHLPALHHAQSSGIQIVALSELPADEMELHEMKLYELCKETSFDIPGFSGDYSTFKEWKKWTLQHPGSSYERLFIAMNGEQFAGVAHLLHHKESSSMYHEYTGVRREYRGQGIAYALKVKCIEHALSRGVKYLRTNNDSMNAPMLGINRDRLGFEAVPGFYKMVKRLREE